MIFKPCIRVSHNWSDEDATCHFGYQCIVHHPNKSMFNKMALVVTPASGGVMKSTIKDMTDSLAFWGVSRIFKYGK